MADSRTPSPLLTARLGMNESAIWFSELDLSEVVQNLVVAWLLQRSCNVPVTLIE